MSSDYIFGDDCQCPVEISARRDFMQTKFWVLSVFVLHAKPTIEVRLTGGRINQILEQDKKRCKGCVARVLTELEKEGKVIREAAHTRGKSSTWSITGHGIYCRQCMFDSGFR